MDFYEQIAPYYHHIFPLNPSQVEFVKNSFTNPSRASLLEVGCGIGLLSFALAPSFFKITAFDLDEGMLKEAQSSRQNLTIEPNCLEFLHLNMLHIGNQFGQESFDGVICFGNTLAHLDSKKSVLKFFLQAKEVLKPNGRLLFQVLNYDLILDQHILSLPIIENETIRFERHYAFPIDPSIVEFKTILTIKKSQKEIVHCIPLLPIRKYEIEELLRLAGFSHYKIYGNYARELFGPECDSVVVEAS